jgi:hypothetical protein
MFLLLPQTGWRGPTDRQPAAEVSDRKKIKSEAGCQPVTVSGGVLLPDPAMSWIV